MKQINSFSILFTLILLLLTSSLAAAAFIPEAGEIPYQINNSDHVVIGTVSEVETHDNFANNTITVDEWLYNPLAEKTIIVRTTSWAEDARFTKNAFVLLMLNNKSSISISNESPISISNESHEKGIFYMSLGELGKHPVSDRDAVIKELKALGKWKGEDQTENKTNDIELKSGASANSSQDTQSKGAIFKFNDSNSEHMQLPDFGPQAFEEAKKLFPGFITTRGTMPEIHQEENKKKWIDLLIIVVGHVLAPLELTHIWLSSVVLLIALEMIFTDIY